METENLKVIKQQLTLNMRKRVKEKEETDQQTGNFTTFPENRKQTQKMRKRAPKKRKPINKLRIKNFV